MGIQRTSSLLHQKSGQRKPHVGIVKGILTGGTFTQGWCQAAIASCVQLDRCATTEALGRRPWGRETETDTQTTEIKKTAREHN